MTVVFNDGAFGNVRRIQQNQFAGRVIGSELVNPDYVRLAEAFGVRGERVASPEGLAGAVRAAIASGEPALVEVPVGAMPNPWPILEPWMAARYAEPSPPQGPVAERHL